MCVYTCISVCFNKHVSSTLIYKTGNFVWFPVVWKDSRELWALVVIAASLSCIWNLSGINTTVIWVVYGVYQSKGHETLNWHIPIHWVHIYQTNFLINLAIFSPVALLSQYLWSTFINKNLKQLLCKWIVNAGRGSLWLILCRGCHEFPTNKSARIRRTVSFLCTCTYRMHGNIVQSDSDFCVGHSRLVPKTSTDPFAWYLSIVW